MNIKQLEIFVSIVTTGSFSKGAEAACITQSTASQHIATLEDICGVRLLDRTGRGVMPTEAGKVLLVHARQVLRSLKETDQALLRFRHAEGVELSVGGSTIPGTYLLPRAIAALRSTDSGLTVRAAIGDSTEILEKLVSEQVELAVIGRMADDRHFSSEMLGHDDILLVAAKGHIWSGRREIKPEELSKVPVVMREPGSGTQEVVVAALRQKGIRMADMNVSATLSSSEAIKQGVLSDCGVAFISRMAVSEELKQGKLVNVGIRGMTINRTFFLVQRKGRTLSPGAEKFAKILQVVSGQSNN